MTKKKEAKQPRPGGSANPSRKIQALRVEIEEHNYRYHVLDDPAISDSRYDGLVRDLEKLEADSVAGVIHEALWNRSGFRRSQPFVLNSMSDRHFHLIFPVVSNLLA